MKQIPDNDIKRLDLMLSASRSMVIAVHTRPDGDAVGSAMGLKHFVDSHEGRHAVVLLPNPASGQLSFLTAGYGLSDVIVQSSDPHTAADAIAQSDLIVCLDCASFDRTEGLSDALIAADKPKILIDHHLNPARDQFDLVFSEIQISSASELLYHILKKLPEIDGDASRLPASAQLAMMTGMTTDTNNFANSVYPSTLAMASELLAAGVDRDAILSHLYNEFREERLRTMGYMLDRKLTITPEGVAVTVLDAEELRRLDVQEGETEGYVNMPLSIASVRMSVFVKEDNGFMRVSVRSKVGTSANKFAVMFFHGGGHEQASGGRIYIPGDIDSAAQAQEYLESCAKKFFEA